MNASFHLVKHACFHIRKNSHIFAVGTAALGFGDVDVLQLGILVSLVVVWLLTCVAISFNSLPDTELEPQVHHHVFTWGNFGIGQSYQVTLHLVLIHKVFVQSLGNISEPGLVPSRHRLIVDLSQLVEVVNAEHFVEAIELVDVLLAEGGDGELHIAFKDQLECTLLGMIFLNHKLFQPHIYFILCVAFGDEFFDVFMYKAHHTIFQIFIDVLCKEMECIVAFPVSEL